MKKLFTLAVALITSIGIWAVEPTLETIEWVKDVEQISNVITNYDDITLSSSVNDWGGSNGGYHYFSLSDNLKATDASWVGYLGIASTNVIDSISILWCPNGNNETNLAWVGWGENLEPSVDITAYGTTVGVTSAKSYDNAIWQTIDLTQTDIYTVYVSRSVREFKLNGTKVANQGKGQTICVYGIRVYTQGGTSTESYTVTYKANGGVGEDVVVEGAKRVAANTFEAPEGKTFDIWNTAAAGDGIDYSVGEAVTSDLTLYAQWVDITACANIIPATAGDELKVGDEVALSVLSEGGKILVAGLKEAGAITYTQYGLGLTKGGADSIRVVLDNKLQAGTIITLNMVAGGTDSRGLNIMNGKTKVYEAVWKAETNGEATSISYVVTASDGLAGKNVFGLQRNNTVYLTSIEVSNCGEYIGTDEPNTDPVLVATPTTITLDVTAAETAPSAKVNFAGKNLTAGTYNLTIPSVDGLTVTPSSVTIAEDGRLNADVVVAYTSSVNVDATSAVIGLTIDGLTQNVTVNYSATLVKNYATSLNIEQLVLDNGVDYDIKAALAAANIDYASIDALDSLNDEKDYRNYGYLGLKVKKTDSTIAFWLKQGSTLKVRFGYIDNTGTLTVSTGTEETLAADTYTNAIVEDENEYSYTATDDDTYVVFSWNSTKTLVFKQIMIDEDIATVVLPEEPGTGTSLDNTAAAQKAHKIVRDGQLLIIRDGKTYTAQGVELK